MYARMAAPMMLERNGMMTMKLAIPSAISMPKKTYLLIPWVSSSSFGIEVVLPVFVYKCYDVYGSGEKVPLLPFCECS